MQYIQILRCSLGALTWNCAVDVPCGNLGGAVNTGGEVPLGGPFTRLLSVISPDDPGRSWNDFCRLATV